MSEYKFVLFLVIAIIFLLIHLFNVKNNNEQVEEYDGIGMITRINIRPVRLSKLVPQFCVRNLL